MRELFSSNLFPIVFMLIGLWTVLRWCSDNVCELFKSCDIALGGRKRLSKREQLLAKCRNDADLQNVLSTYHDGSVFVPYPATSQAIEDLIERRVLTLRNPKAAKLNPHGAWYDLSKQHYDDLCKPAQEEPQE